MILVLLVSDDEDEVVNHVEVEEKEKEEKETNEEEGQQRNGPN